MTEVASGLLVQAVQLALNNVEAGQRPFGAIVVRDGAVIGEGVNTVLREHDPTAHAEVEAIRSACRGLVSADVGGAVIYTSCEPCAMCQAAGVAAGVEQMVFAVSSQVASDLGFPAPDRARRMQDAWRIAMPSYTEPGPDIGELAIAPFRRWIERFEQGIVP